MKHNQNINASSQLSPGAKEQIELMVVAHDEVMGILHEANRPLNEDEILSRCDSEAKYVLKTLDNMIRRPEITSDARGYRLVEDFARKTPGVCDSCEQDMIYHQNEDRDFCPVCEDL